LTADTRNTTEAWWVSGPGWTARVGRLANDIVDEDRKGRARWLHKHVRYAEMELEKRGRSVPLRERIGRFRSRDQTGTRPLTRIILKDLVFPAVPGRPVTVFLYMYVFRLGLLDGRAGAPVLLFSRLVSGHRWRAGHGGHQPAPCPGSVGTQ
jgi:hypothetical protein